jgi:hypothetical protein
MNKELLALERTRLASKKEILRTTHVEFAPLWQTAGGVGAVLGGLKGSTEQSEDGTQMDSGQRLINVGTNAAGGALLGSGAGIGIPQLLEESPQARQAAQVLKNSTGVAVNPQDLSYAERVRLARQQKRMQGQTLPQKVKRAVDPITGRAEILAEDIGSVGNAVKGVIHKVTGYDEAAAKEARELATANKQALREAVRQTHLDETARQLQSATRQAITSPEALQRIQTSAQKTAEPLLKDILDTRTPLQKLGGTIVEGAKGAAGLERKAAAGTKQGVSYIRKALGFSYMDEGEAMFSTPYTTGAAAGSIIGGGVGAGLGLGVGLEHAQDEEDRQLRAIQSIPDPYARKKQWDIYDDDSSRLSRNVGYGVNTASNVTSGAIKGGVGGALLGGSALTIYHNLKNRKFTPLAKPIPSRLGGLKTFITGK